MARTPRSKTQAATPRTTRSRAAAKPAAPKRKPAAPTPVVTSETTDPVTGPDLKKQELLAKVVSRSGIKKKDAKPVVEAMLEVMGEALAEGRELNLQPFGKVKLNRTREMPKARVIVAKIRQSKNDGGTKESVAAAAE